MSWKDKQFALMRRLQQCCDEQGIPLFLFQETALAAWRDGVLADDPMVCVDARYAGQLIKALGENTESMLTHPAYPYFELRYYDPATIDFNLAQIDKYEQQCLSVKVKFIQHVPDPAQEKQLAKLYSDYKKGKGKPAAEVFRAMCEGYSGDGPVALVNGKQMPSALFDVPMAVTIGETSFFIPANIEVYFLSLFGPAWAEQKISAFKESAGRFRDGDHAYSDYKARLADLDFAGYAAAKKKYDDLTKQFNAINAKMKQDYTFMERTHYRYKLWQQYMPQKEQLLAMAGDGAFGDLAVRFADYFAALEDCRKKGLGLCFDKDLFEAAMKTLAATGREADAAVYRVMVPPAHFAPLSLTDYRGDAL